MEIIILAAGIWGVVTLLRLLKEHAQQQAINRERRKIQQESDRQAAMRAEWRAQQAQAATAATTETSTASPTQQDIDKLTRQVKQADADIEHWREQTGRLYALLDIAENELNQSIIGGKNQEKYQKQVIAYNNQIHAAETRIAKAEGIKADAQKKLNAA